MSAPLSMESAVGYVAAEDVYVAYSEYYGDGTIYGRVDLLLNGEPVRGAGKSKKDLVEAGVVLSENVAGSVNGDLVVVPDSAPEAECAPAAEAAAEAEAECAPEAEPGCCQCSGRYTVTMVIAGFTVTRELNAKINEESRQIYLCD